VDDAELEIRAFCRDVLCSCDGPATLVEEKAEVDVEELKEEFARRHVGNKTDCILEGS
jgi:hypothetical protein